MRALPASVVALPLIYGALSTFAPESDPEVRARETEQPMTDEERFGLIRSLMAVVFGQGGGRDSRVPEQVPQIAGWVKGAQRLGVPDLPLFPPLATACTPVSR
jgi:hypothetical protein